MTNAEAIEAVAKVLKADENLLPDGLTPIQAYEWAIFKVRTIALNLRLQDGEQDAQQNTKTENRNAHSLRRQI